MKGVIEFADEAGRWTRSTPHEPIAQPEHDAGPSHPDCAVEEPRFHAAGASEAHVPTHLEKKGQTPDARIGIMENEIAQLTEIASNLKAAVGTQILALRLYGC